MKSIVVILLATLMATTLFVGCAGMTMSPVAGFIYTDVKAPMYAVAADMNGTSAAKIGTASATSILGWIATGDASIEAAMKAGGITKLHHVDYQAMQVLGLFAKFSITAYGE